MSEIKKNKGDEDTFTNQKLETDRENTWAEDQKKHGYYYDDTCGYEIYIPEDEEKESEEQQIKR